MIATTPKITVRALPIVLITYSLSTSDATPTHIPTTMTTIMGRESFFLNTFEDISASALKPKVMEVEEDWGRVQEGRCGHAIGISKQIASVLV
jgi:hypothetical protein